MTDTPAARARARVVAALSPAVVHTLDEALANARKSPGRAVRAFRDAGKALG